MENINLENKFLWNKYTEKIIWILWNVSQKLEIKIFLIKNKIKNKKSQWDLRTVSTELILYLKSSH